MQRIKAIIFDMDGVIVDSESRHERAYLDIVREIGYGDARKVKFSDYVGRSDQELWVDFVNKYHPPHSPETLLEMKSRRVVEIIAQDQPLYEGLPELVEKLSGRYRLALASGSSRVIVDAVLALRNLRRFFSVTVSDSEVSRGKPAPDIFLKAAELLKMPPAECCVIEDSVAGVAAGLTAGMKVIAITNTFPAHALCEATHVVRTYDEIERLLLV